MAVIAPLSKYKKGNFKIVIAVLIGLALWFAYDGYLNKSFIEKHTQEDGAPNGTLVFNQKSPPFLAGAAVLMGLWYFRTKDKKVVADESSLIVGKTRIPFDSIERIDKTHFDSNGYFTVIYKTETGSEAELRLNERTYDNLPAVLEELIRQIT
ncbi:MAG: hypothetical protein JW828_14090 [Sedimentisphaerales bacterium]|nr:hypothetical protein [Sedimentisphaerales bacterium]